MSESRMRRVVVRALKPLHPVAIESHITPGTPDVNFSDGWIELKYLKTWPKYARTKVRISHFTTAQKRWLKKRWEINESSWLLIKCRQEWLLFNGFDAAKYVGESTRAELYEHCTLRWTKGLTNKELIECLLKVKNIASPTVIDYSSKDAAKNLHKRSSRHN